MENKHCLLSLSTLLLSTLSLQDFEKISEYFKAHYKVELSEKELCVKGWNWGTTKFSGKDNTTTYSSFQRTFWL